MMRNTRIFITVFAGLFLSCLSLCAQADRSEVRAGNRQFRKGNWQKAEIDYRKALLKDSTSFAASYNLAGALYREENFEEAGKALEAVRDAAPLSVNAADYYYNQGNVAVQGKDWGAAVEAYRQSLLRNPGDMEAKENYAYAKLMLKNQENGGDGQNQDQNQNQNQDQNQNQNQDQDQDQNQDQDQDQNQDQNQNQNQDQNQGNQPQPQQGQISPQQAQQLLKAIQAREKETQEKVNKEKAAVMKSRQKEKNW